MQGCYTFVCVLWAFLAMPIKKAYRKLLCLSTCKKWTSSPTSFWRYCKDIAISKKDKYQLVGNFKVVDSE